MRSRGKRQIKIKKYKRTLSDLTFGDNSTIKNTKHK